jgi:hexosaminidase
MNFKGLYVYFFLIPAVLSGQTSNLNLLPLPKSMAIKSGKCRITGNFSIAVFNTGKDEILYTSVIRLIDKINKKSNGAIHPIIQKTENTKDSALIRIITDKSEEIQIGMDESYSIVITPVQLILKANNTVGAMRGMETILQLLSKDDKSYYFPIVEVMDSPRFSWRGLMIDVSRHFIPIDVLKRNIEAMSQVKMNVLHLHLSDNESFRFESKIFPELQAKGSDGNFYHQSELTDLIRFAVERGILIVP